MDTLLDKAKRKKRKSRKCLDEMRKRSRDCFTGLASIQSNLKNNGSENCIPDSKQNTLTANVLNLNLLTKAVRSETVTRPVSNLKQFTRFNVGSTENNAICSPKVNNCNYARNQISQKISNYATCRNTDKDSTGSPILFSPLNHSHSENDQFDNFTNEEAIISLTTSPSRSENGNDVIHLYEDLMDTISNSIKVKFTKLAKDDIIIRKMKKSLQNIRTEHYRKGLETKVCVMNNASAKVTNEAIVQDPMRYIRLGCMLQGSHYKHREEISNEDTSPTRDYLYSSYEEPENQSPVYSSTPEYDFFPHKLN